MASSSLEIVKLCGSPVSISRHQSPVKLEPRKRVFRLADSRNWHRLGRCVRVCSSARDGDNQSKGDEPPESLFMKELKRRGMTPTSLLQDYEVDVDEVKTGKETGNSTKTTATTPAFDQSLLNQRERSLALNSEGLEGLIPRAKILLTIGGTFFLGFWPLIVLTLGAFSALYLYFGADFVHDGSRTPVSPPPYIDPYALLEDERISGIDPRVN
ncbi:hypothetical protein EUTSA_v10011774mg [Eutrema salsugineum]|uniref:Tubulin alpha chain n=2 Tax=Eutrema TaxID=98005 RepID=V4KSY2_EUTSA|nr:uncharacterized protein LOC18011183 [Eutrema salsugineum]ESQ30473.1 hypothetical protein EUTSA_v10011774mg [Eutrema salsugineum]BAJ34041.1 unnamed protein product [Eutrema halophilum]